MEPRKAPPHDVDPRQTTKVQQSVMGARAFYFGMYALFYFSAVMYRTDLGANAYTFTWYIPLAVTSAYLFMTTGRQPGYLDQYPPS